MSNTNNSSGGIGFIGVLTILFIALKLTGYIDWHWAWVLSPIWIGIPILFVIAVIIFIVLLIADNK